MDIGEVLSRAWQIVWKHKVMWIFGILASCSGAGGNSGTGYQISSQDIGGQSPFSTQLNIAPEQWTLIIALLVIVMLALVLLAIFLSTVGQIGLIRGTLKAETGAEKLRFGELFSEGAGYFWRILGLALLVGLVGMLLLVLIGVPFMIITCGLGLLLVIPLIWLVATVVQMAYNAIAIENKGVMDGLRRGWEVVKRNIGTMVLMSLILYLGIGLIGGLILAIPLMVVLAPVIIGISTLFVGEQQPQWFTAGGIVFGLLCVVIYLPFVIAFGGLLRAYIGSAWTLTYLRLTSKPQVVEPIPNPIQ
jgi:hypothetical protein